MAGVDGSEERRKVDKMVEQAIEITELKVEIRLLKETIAEMKTCLAKVEKTVGALNVLVLELRLDLLREQNSKPSWVVTIALTILTGLVSALGVYVLTTAGIG